VQPGKLGVVLADDPAPEALKKQRQFDQKLLASSRGGDWQPLPGTRVEVEALQKLFTAAKQPARLLTDSEASEQKLLELAQGGELGKVRYLHLATHGEFHGRLLLQSAVLLSRDALPDAGRQLLANQLIFDGRLTAQEVLQHWKLNAELVTLSACTSGLGTHERGEGYMGFAQAILLSGSRSVCLSLWKVDDTATALLMERFYQNVLGQREGLKAPLKKAAALAEAKKWLRELSQEEAVQRAAALTKGVARGKNRPNQPLLPEVPTAKDKTAKPYAHPYYWAAFVLVGDPD
jgi:CHAT domain-containing protein